MAAFDARRLALRDKDGRPPFANPTKATVLDGRARLIPLVQRISFSPRLTYGGQSPLKSATLRFIRVYARLSEKLAHPNTIWTPASSNAARNSWAGSASVTKSCIEVSEQI